MTGSNQTIKDKESTTICKRVVFRNTICIFLFLFVVVLFIARRLSIQAAVAILVVVWWI